ncbi:MAG: carboxymuconolactone decarboxylase family protein [Pseudomonadota bacterium]
MSRIPTPASIDDAPEAARALLNNVKAGLGSVPNMFRLVANSPAGLEGFLGLNSALGKGDLEPAIRERIALALANVNGCDYCNAAHTYLGKNVAKLSDDEITLARQGRSGDAKADIAVAFARKVAVERANVSEADVDAVRKAGFSDAELVEIVLHVALNTLTNYVNEVFGTEVDFPAVPTADRIAA